MALVATAWQSWRAVHWSTIIGASLFCGGLVLVNIPGTRTGLARQHGWPVSYLRREEPEPPHQAGVIRCRAYRVPDIWSLTADVAEFRPVGLIVNLAVIATITVSAAAALEWYRRIHGSFLRFSLRTAGIGVVTCSICFAWMHYRVAGWNKLRPAIEQLERAGGRIQYASILPEWIREPMGDRLGRPFDSVWSVSLSYSSATDADLRPLELLPAIRHLDLASTQITDGGLESISGLTHLTWLSLDHTKVTDAGLAHLRHLRCLTCLGLDETKVAGPGLKNLAGMDQLDILALRKGPLTDSGLEFLTGLPSLSVVYTSGTMVTRAGADRFQARSANHITIDCRISSDFDTGTSPSPWNGETDPFR